MSEFFVLVALSLNGVLVKNFNGVFDMSRRWCGRNVDLEILSLRICDFFGEKGFDVRRDFFHNGYKIIAEGSSAFELSGCVNVVVNGFPRDFVVTLSLCEKNGKKLFSTGPLTMSLFGLGGLFLQRLRSRENWIILERDFWRFLENVLLQLSNSV